MQSPLQITTRDIPHSEALDDHIRQKAAKLETFYPHIMGCRVVVEMPHRHKHQGRKFNVRLDITVPSSELVVNREANDVYVALRDAFDAARRQIKSFGSRRRGAVKSHAPLLHGRVSRLVPEEGYGFIESTDGHERYFHRLNLANGDFDRLEPGGEVHFLEGMATEGLQAKRVRADRHHHH